AARPRHPPTRLPERDPRRRLATRQPVLPAGFPDHRTAGQDPRHPWSWRAGRRLRPPRRGPGHACAVWRPARPAGTRRPSAFAPTTAASGCTEPALPADRTDPPPDRRRRTGSDEAPGPAAQYRPRWSG